MTPAFKAAGISILQHAYATCERLGVDKREIPELLSVLSLAVAQGQEPTDSKLPRARFGVRPKCKKVSDVEIAQIHAWHREGMAERWIAGRLQVNRSVVKRILKAAG